MKTQRREKLRASMRDAGLCGNCVSRLLEAVDVDVAVVERDSLVVALRCCLQGQGAVRRQASSWD